jgi:sensor histidine kinase YesM
MEEAYLPHLLFFAAAFGAFLMTAAFHFTLYLQQRDRVFRAYAAYLFLYALFILVRILDDRLVPFRGLDYTVVYHLDELAAKLTLIAYVNFMGHLFVTPDMKLHRVGWRILQWATYAYCAAYALLALSGVSIVVLEPATFISSIGLIGFGAFLIVKVFKYYRNPFYQLIIAGSLLLAFSTFSGVIYNMVTGSDKLNLVAYSLMLAGGIPEIIFLSAALGYRLKMAYKERAEAQEALIVQLQRNEELARTLNEELEALVRERTDEIRAASTLLEQEKEEKLLAEFDKQIAEAQLTALSAQMNPHFIFNCMNSIQKYVLKNEKEKALAFLQHFSELMRIVLDNSTKTRVPLDEEIRLLEKYMLLEQQRLDHKCDYAIRVDPGLQTDFVEIPTMIIQPYVENAIWHGLMNKPGQGRLTLDFIRADGYLTCVIEDNGIGRQEATHLAGEGNTVRKGYGMAISRKRMELLQREHAQLPDIRIEDLADASGRPAGTRITLHFHLD